MRVSFSGFQAKMCPGVLRGRIIGIDIEGSYLDFTN